MLGLDEDVSPVDVVKMAMEKLGDGGEEEEGEEAAAALKELAAVRECLSLKAGQPIVERINSIQAKLNPHDEDKMTWALKHATKDAESFTELMDGAPKLFEPGRAIDSKDARSGGKTDRQKMIDEEVLSFKENSSSGIFGDSTMVSIVNTGLRMKDEPVMTEAETKVLEGGKV